MRRGRDHTVVLCCLLATLSLAGALRSECVAASACAVQDTIGLGPEYGNGSSGAAFGEARAETFAAAETLLTFLRVWRVASQDSDWQIGMHPYITETKATEIYGGGIAPDQTKIVWDGPCLVIPNGDGVHPIEFRWDFNPPLTLPHRGEYAFFLFQCPCIAYWDILATDQPQLYPGGDLWQTGRSNCVLGSRVLGLVGPYTTYDLIFQIGFCHDSVTPVRRGSWGALKMLYR